MSSKNISDTKVGFHMLQNKLKNLKEYDLKFGTDIIKSLSKNIMTYDDILSQPLCNINLNGYGGEKYLTNEINNVTDIYNDLITKLTDKSGCGDEPQDQKSPDVKKFKTNFMNITGMNSKPKKPKYKNNMVSVGVKKSSKKEKMPSKKKSKKSKSKSKKYSSNIIF
jgi:hypothetical protein